MKKLGCLKKNYGNYNNLYIKRKLSEFMRHLLGEFKTGKLAVDEKLEVVEIKPEEAKELLQELKKKEFRDFFWEKNRGLTAVQLKEAINVDHCIMQAIQNVRDVDSNINSLAKRLREWFSLFVPELDGQIEDHAVFVNLVLNKSVEELKNMKRYAFRKFYLRPSYIIKRILKIRSFEDIKRYFNGGMGLIKAFL